MADVECSASASQVAAAAARYGTLLYPVQDAILGPSLRLYGEWAQREVDLLLALLPSGGTAVDVGAFVGTHTLAFARHRDGTCRVIAFEPNPWSFDLLARNVEQNGLRNVTLHRAALAAREDRLAFAPADGSADNFGHARLVDAGGATGVRVDAAPLDALALARCDVLKVDVEGMEADVLQGARATLERCRPVVYCECNALAQGWPVFLLMREHGYTCHGHCFAAYNPANFRGEANNVFGNARELGLLFVPDERRAGVAALLDDRDRLAPVATLDDLALCLLRKPQYKLEVLASTAAAAALGTAFVGDESVATEAAALRAHVDRMQRALDEAQSLAWGRAEELERLDHRLAETQAAHEFAQQLAHARAADLVSAADERTRLRRELAAAQRALGRLAPHGAHTALAATAQAPPEPRRPPQPPAERAQSAGTEDNVPARQGTDGHD